MSQPGSGAVQPQWNLLETVLLAKDAIVTILKACSDEDVQGQAVLALEGLGFGLMVHEQRRQAGQNALRSLKHRVIHQLRLFIGPSRGDLAVYMSRSQNLIASFLLVCACKICFKDESTGKLLFEMMKSKGILDQAPVLPWQVSQLVSTVSGFSDNLQGILPSDVFSQVRTAVHQRLRSPDEILGLLERCPLETLARILSEILTGLQDVEIRRITVEGSRTGIWLATFFLWLCPDDTECTLRGSPMFGNAKARLSIDLVQGANWKVQMWRLETKLPSLIFKTEERLRSPGFLYQEYYPLQEAKTVIRSSSTMSEQAIEATGQLAAALVDV